MGIFVCFSWNAFIQVLEIMEKCKTYSNYNYVFLNRACKYIQK